MNLLDLAREVVAGVEHVGPHGATTQLSRRTWDELEQLVEEADARPPRTTSARRLPSGSYVVARVQRP